MAQNGKKKMVKIVKMFQVYQHGPNGQIARNCTTGPKWFKSPRMVQNVSKTAQMAPKFTKMTQIAQKWPTGLFQKYLLEGSERNSFRDALYIKLS